MSFWEEEEKDLDKKLLAKIEELIVRAITYSKFGTNQQVVAAAGTAVRLMTESLPCAGVWLQSLAANTGLIYWGSHEEVSALSGVELDIGAGIWIPIDNVDKIWIDCAVNGEGVCWAAVV